ncbi:MAG TPA: diacylglycerol kinase family protein [Candidatus Saccharimonadales bacterium]|nr:diacylglycerol kinase family protein [Candidatus Saccharimonadales bacterium]
MTPDPIPTRPALVIVNGRASRLHDPRRRAALRARIERSVLARTGRTPDVVEGSHDEAHAALADPIGRPLVVIAGGDGSIRSAAGTLADTGVPLAVVPGGTGNVLAHALRIRGIDQAIRTIEDGRVTRLDLGQARWGDDSGQTGARLFTVASGMGFDAQVMAAAEHEWKRRLAFGAYVGAAVREAARLRPAHFRIRADDVDLELTGLVALVANCGDLVPGRLGARRPLDPSDGRLDLIVIGGRGIVSGLRGVADVLLRDGDLDGSVIRRHVSRVRIEAEPEQPIETDGDPHPPGWLEADVLPGALSMLAPPA